MWNEAVVTCFNLLTTLALMVWGKQQNRQYGRSASHEDGWSRVRSRDSNHWLVTADRKRGPGHSLKRNHAQGHVCLPACIQWASARATSSNLFRFKSARSRVAGCPKHHHSQILLYFYRRLTSQAYSTKNIKASIFSSSFFYRNINTHNLVTESLSHSPWPVSKFKLFVYLCFISVSTFTPTLLI